MKEYTITYRVRCGLTIPDGKFLEIGNFVFTPDFEGERIARNINVKVNAANEEEAKRVSFKKVDEFLNSLTIIDGSKYLLENPVPSSVSSSGNVTVHTVTISTKAFISQDGNRIKKIFEKSLLGRKLRKTPLKHYRDAINALDVFSAFVGYYKVLDFYNKDRITGWIMNKKPKIIKKSYVYRRKRHRVTILTWIRHRIVHTTRIINRGKEGVTPLYISNNRHVGLVQKYLRLIRVLARENIREKEGV
jgi:hypothetical protein